MYLSHKIVTATLRGGEYIYIYMDICSLSPPVREESYIQSVLYEVEWGACPKVLWQFKKGHDP